MKDILKTIGSAVGGAASAAYSFLKGKKRFIALSLLGISKIIPGHTAVGQASNFLKDNLGNIEIGLEVTAGLFAAGAVYDVVKGKLPSGLSDKMKDEK